MLQLERLLFRHDGDKFAFCFVKLFPYLCGRYYDFQHLRSPPLIFRSEPQEG